MSSVPEALKFTSDHEWVETRGEISRIGITDFAQAALGDIVYVQLPQVGDALEAGKVCGEIESTKSVSDLFSPVTGVVSAVNDLLSNSPESLNSDPYGSGWIFEVSGGEVGTTLTAMEYRAAIGE